MAESYSSNPFFLFLRDLRIKLLKKNYEALPQYLIISKAADVWRGLEDVNKQLYREKAQTNRLNRSDAFKVRTIKRKSKSGKNKKMRRNMRKRTRK